MLYTYDALGQLLTETVNDTLVNVMTYDDYGNILTKNGVAYTYSDGAWKDLLTSYNGQPIIYDAQGNPTSYLGHTLTWEKGRQLKSFDGNTYTYNANGIRTSKTVAGVKHDYILDGTKILREEWCGNILTPIYDNEDSVCGIIYNGEPYYFLKTLQDDVIAIVDKNAKTVAQYSYDAWGVCTSAVTHTEQTGGVDIANINPFRYRSYYFDKEIEMYYLQSRYYDPQLARFVNSDRSDLVNFAGKNLFTYCFNIPVTYVDYNGNIPQAFVIVAAVIVASFINSLLLSIAMYAYAATGARFSSNIDISAWWNPIGSLMKGRLEDSRLIQERINSYIGKISKSSYSHKEHINFAERKRYSMDRDLWLSVGNASDCTITVTKTGKKRWFSKKQTYRVVIELSDDYDYAKFKREEQGLVLTAINNGLGYYPMSWGILKAYHWKIRHEFNYYYW